MIVREAGPEDVGRLAPLFDGYRRFYRQPADLEGGSRFLAERLGAGESRVFVAETVDGRPLGFVQLFPSFSSVSMRRLWILNDLFVAPDARRSGVARVLMNRARELAVETGAKGLILETESHNAPAKRLYEELGWTLDGADHYELLV
ncbi:MAG: GNAT family N-acetyltransferase [Gemmatimonadales bacterium]|nr:GNAT family N-acetyltransferase [Gemmatimonadales bacterium]MYG50002.1 GNAT family N-acetyltransferase [Gemmatimonadales bacterium]MYK00637.1 GNAT family N-acetyltransferase [Candidatus Palauibacter ramosifaciens]